MGLPSVGQEDYHHDDEEQPSSSCDAEDGRNGEQAVGADVNFTGGDVKSSYLDLDKINNNTSKRTIFQIQC